MNEVLKEILETNSVRSPDGKTFPLHSHIPRVEGEVIRKWIVEHRPRKLLEIGLGYGVSSLFICDSICDVSDASYHIIDAFQSNEWQSIGTYNLKRAGYEKAYVLHEELSEICLPRMLAEKFTFDFALIDGWHTFDHVLVDFYYVNRMLEAGGLVVFDDVHLPSIRKVMAHVATYECYKPLSIPDVIRQSVRSKARRILNLPEVRIGGFVKMIPDNRNWDWYREF